MKKLMMLAAALLLAGYAHTAAAADNTIRPILGFNASAVDFGVDYEKRMNHDMGVGGYFFYGSEKKAAGIYQVVAFGAMAPIHLLDNGTIDTYLAPGIGIAIVSGLASTSYPDDTTTFGPSMKLGAEWKFTPVVKGGIQYFEVYNWFSDKAPAYARYASLTLGIGF